MIKNAIRANPYNDVARSQLYLLDTDSKFGSEKTSQDIMRLGQYVNPDLADTSTYYQKLDNMMKCVSKNAELARPGMEDL